MSKRKKKNTGPKTCDTCEHCVYICEGDYACMVEMPPKLVVDDWVQSDDYMWCGGKKWEAST